MKAFRFETVDQGLCLQQVPPPSPSPGEVVVRVEAAGICHSDLHVLHGQGSGWMSKLPITLGHEVAGIVEEVGPDVVGFKIGDRVGVALLPKDADLTNVIGIAAITGSTTVAIVGLGGLGLSGVGIASIEGATVLGVDIDDKKFADATAFGAKACFKKLDDIPSEVIIDVVVDFAGVGTTTQDALRRFRSSGMVVLVGFGVPTFELSTNTLMSRNLTLRGLVGSTMAEYRKVLDLIASGLIKPKLEEIPFLEIPNGLRRLERLEVVGRLFSRPNA
ncbi:hypothetical protein COCCADRAFT_40800 [Bipolaris zeicola 26-R-13]|uniref:Enoyl reductase (ER) domain-containing protein n=1 Tax=Cochliobolus carbonum (strain 26-R-13) TaxID=930089 RepID=W6XSW7_COCC2|nr:uncharacterized protein COCCADRAFT_40800 [Bipolaris zeicola 26-R-13]EUC28733.1 hypothetical protein COCCADRAFT_40800 [Bipolaris zeicola 26-R-13]